MTARDELIDYLYGTFSDPPHNWTRELCETEAQDILAALAAAGYVIVPREPTNKMLQAHPIASDLLPVEVVMQRRREIWSAMLTASEQKP